MKERKKKKKVLFPKRRLLYEKVGTVISFPTFARGAKKEEKGILIKTSQCMVVRKFIGV